MHRCNEYRKRHQLRTKTNVKSCVLDESGKWSIGEVPLQFLIPDPGFFESSYVDKIISMAETEKLFDNLIAKDIIKYPTFTDSEGFPDGKVPKRTIIWHGCQDGGVFDFIGEYLSRIPTLNFDLEIFNKCYFDFEHYYLSDAVPFTAIIPLLNFSSDMDIIEIDDEISIVHLSNSERARLGAHMFMMRDPNLGDLAIVKKVFSSGFAIKCSFFEKKRVLSCGDTHKKAEEVLITLRLLKSGNPLYDIILTEPVGFNPVTAGLGSSHTDRLYSISPRQEEDLHLTVEDCVLLKNVWQRLQHIFRLNDQGKLDVGIRKFSNIYERKFLEDRIIDMSILLESTLLYGIKDELKYRLSLRGAHLLGSNREPEETFRLLREFYDVRSTIVHNGNRLTSQISVDKRPFSPADFVAEMEAVCREVLRTYIDKVARGDSISNVNKDLDNEALHSTLQYDT